MKTNKTEVPKKYPYVDEENNLLYLNENMVVVNETIKMRWSSNNKKRYTDLGYECVDWNEPFDIHILDVIEGSAAKVKVVCPVLGCRKQRLKPYCQLLSSGHSKCKGCSQVIDRTGHTYGEWTVLEEFEPGKWGRARWLCECVCGRRYVMRGSKLQSGHATTCKYKHGKTDKERNIVADYRHFTLPVYERDNFTCQVTGDNIGGNLEAHHLNGRKDFIEQRLDINNGVTIRKDIHREFHVDYMGHYQNGCTKQDFIDFCKKRYPDAPFLE